MTLREDVERDLPRIDPPNYVLVPYPADVLEQREEYRQRWEAIVAEGTETGFLDWDVDTQYFISDSEGKYERNPDTRPTETVVAWQRRVDAEVAHRQGVQDAREEYMR